MNKILVCLVVLIWMLGYIHSFTLKQNTGYKDFNRAVLAPHNKARTDPKFFAGLISEQTQRFVYDKDGKPTKTLCTANDFVPKGTVCYNSVQTEEGIPVWEETIKYLNEFKTPLKELKWSESLAQAWYDHILDQGPKGTDGHKGSDGKMPEYRIYKYVDSNLVGENLEYSDVKYPEDPIIGLLIDDGFKSRGHRYAIMDKEFTHVGISWGCHKKFIEMWCFAYGKDIIEKNPNFVANYAPQLNTCVDYTPFTKDEASGLYTLSSITTAPPIPTKPNPRKVVETIGDCTITSVYFVGGLTRIYDFKVSNGDGTYSSQT